MKGHFTQYIYMKLNGADKLFLLHFYDNPQKEGVGMELNQKHSSPRF
jgi:hypothetical protein